MTTLFILIGHIARYWLDPNFRDECDLEEALECEGEDGPTVARILERMRRRNSSLVTRHPSPVTPDRREGRMKGRLKTPVARECRICGKTFHATAHHQVCCSDECRAAARKAWHATYGREWRKRPGNPERLCHAQKEYRERMKAAQRAVPRLRRAIYEINAIVSDAYSLGAPRDVSEKLCEAIKLAAKTLKTI